MYGKQNGVDLGDLEKGPISQMMMDPTVLGTTIWAVFKDRIESAGLTQGSFYDSLDGPTVKEVTASIKQSITDFFPWGKQVMEELDEMIANLREAGETMQVQAPHDNRSPVYGPSSGSAPESAE